MAASPDVERLTRWADAGGSWRVVTRTPTRLTVALLRCDGGEEMDRFVSTDPALLAFLEGRTDSES